MRLGGRDLNQLLEVDAGWWFPAGQLVWVIVWGFCLVVSSGLLA